MKTYIIAEIGINHNGSLENAKKLIDMSKTAKCDCAKFQFFKAADLYPKFSGKLKWGKMSKKYSYDIYKVTESLEIPDYWIGELISYCNKEGIDFMASVLSVKGLDFLIKKGLKKIKLPSSTVGNIPLIRHCARTRLPVFISTGAADIGEVANAVESISRYHTNITLMQCTMKYPALLSECNLGVLDTYKHAFPFAKTGFSDHTKSVFEAAKAAVLLGATAIEKHVTLDKNMPGPDHFFSLTPDELKRMVKEIRLAEKRRDKGFLVEKRLYGSTEKRVLKSEKYLKEFTRPSLFAAKDIKKFDPINVKDLKIFRKSNFKDAIPSEYIELFKSAKITAKKDMTKHHPITWESIF